MDVRREYPPIQIDRDIPPPAHNASGRPVKYPFRAMEVGDSFFIAENSERVRAARSRFEERSSSPGIRFICRNSTENGVHGVRVWRVA